MDGFKPGTLQVVAKLANDFQSHEAKTLTSFLYR